MFFFFFLSFCLVSNSVLWDYDRWVVYHKYLELLSYSSLRSPYEGCTKIKQVQNSETKTSSRIMSLILPITLLPFYSINTRNLFWTYRGHHTFIRWKMRKTKKFFLLQSSSSLNDSYLLNGLLRRGEDSVLHSSTTYLHLDGILRNETRSRHDDRKLRCPYRRETGLEEPGLSGRVYRTHKDGSVGRSCPSACRRPLPVLP